MLTCRDTDIEQIVGWEELQKESSTVTFFQTKDWLQLWVKHFSAKGEIKILGVFDGKSLVGIVPLQIKNEIIRFLGTSPVLGGELVGDFGDIIAFAGKEKEVWSTVLSYIKDNKKVILGIRQLAETPESDSGQARMTKRLDLNFIQENSPSFKILQELGDKVEEIDVAPYIDLPKTWEEYLLSLDRHDRHELRRKIRRLEEECAFKVCHEGDPADIEEFFRLMIATNEQKRNFLSEKMKVFFKDIFAVFWPKKMLQLCFLKLKGENIATILLFSYKNELLLYNSGFEPKFSHLAPGFLLKAFLIKQAIEEGYKRFDFLRGDERYKYDLGAVKRKLYKFSF